ncbi:hypothetical protein LRS10_12025 [Phenylobacterium sp. J426]|uniref:hypothetical protein n=1 Tax=Phenylobacterium sp. J426 TaxID=2898439 RepID=UPI00215193C1|nr:hypothetical protein [Phenylobacterium sp. J426]MCR5874834.1 hypothetical protein [Phenylobacterium sp. J426]
MDDATPTTFADGRAPLLSRENLKRVTAAAPLVRYVPKHPAFLLGAVAVGVLGTLAWRNRQTIAERARPMIDDARTRARPMLESAAARGEALREKLPMGRRPESADPAASI